MTSYSEKLWQHSYHIAKKYENKQTKYKWKKGLAFFSAVSLIIFEIKL